MGKKKSSDTIERIISLYVNEKLPMGTQKLTALQIGNKLGLSPATITNNMKKFNIPRRTVLEQRDVLRSK